MKHAFLPLILLCALTGLSQSARAQVQGPPAFVDYQGTIYDSTGVPYGSAGTPPDLIPAPENKTMEFRVYDVASGGTDANIKWAETQTVTVSLGQFSVRLGSGAQITAPTTLPHGSLAEAFDGKERFLELTVINPGQTPSPILPRLAFQSSPFSFVAEHAKLADEVIGKVTATGGSTFAGTVNATPGSTFAGTVNATAGSTFAGTVNAAADSTFTGGTFTGGNFAGGSFTGGSFTGDGAGLTALSAAAITGSLPDARLSSNVALLNRSTQVFSGTNSFNGNVGIGTTSPTKGKLEISGLGDPINFTTPIIVGTLSQGGAASFPVVGQLPFSLYANGEIAAQAYRAFSDQRIKHIEGRSDGERDLSALLAIEVTDYSYIDTVSKGTGAHKKVIAQQVEKVFPQAVSKSTDVVPDIYQRATCKDGWVSLATDLKKGERVRLIGENEEGVHEVLEVADGRFRTGFMPAGERVFVFGREVDDFRSVDYEAIAMLNVSATQQIVKELDAVKAENAALKSRIALLEARDRARDARLTAIENRLAPSGEPVVQTVSLGEEDP